MLELYMRASDSCAPYASPSLVAAPDFVHVADDEDKENSGVGEAVTLVCERQVLFLAVHLAPAVRSVAVEINTDGVERRVVLNVSEAVSPIVFYKLETRRDGHPGFIFVRASDGVRESVLSTIYATEEWLHRHEYDIPEASTGARLRHTTHALQAWQSLQRALDDVRYSVGRRPKKLQRVQ